MSNLAWTLGDIIATGGALPRYDRNAGPSKLWIVEAWITWSSRNDSSDRCRTECECWQPDVNKGARMKHLNVVLHVAAGALVLASPRDAPAGG